MSRLVQLLKGSELGTEVEVVRFSSADGIKGLGDQPFVSAHIHIIFIILWRLPRRDLDRKPAWAGQMLGYNKLLQSNQSHKKVISMP